MNDSRRLVAKLWSYCDVLRDDGVGVIEYTEQLTYLLFLKMAHERSVRKLRPQQIAPEEYSWQRLLSRLGATPGAAPAATLQPLDVIARLGLISPPLD